MKIRTFLFFAITSCVLISCVGQSNKSNDPIIYAESKDPELEKAKQDAISNLDNFIKSFKGNSNDTILQYSMKIDFVENGEHEHMWVSINKIENDEFFGVLGNDPQIVKNVKIGDYIKIKKEQIEDWLIMNTRTNDWEGGYSVKVLLKRQK